MLECRGSVHTCKKGGYPFLVNMPWKNDMPCQFTMPCQNFGSAPCHVAVNMPCLHPNILLWVHESNDLLQSFRVYGIDDTAAMTNSFCSQDGPSRSRGSSTENRPLKVLIVGGGIVGLTIAQGCRENGIPYELFERDTEGRPPGFVKPQNW